MKKWCLSRIPRGLAWFVVSAAIAAPQFSWAKDFFRPQALATRSAAPQKIPGVVSEVQAVEFNATDMLSLSPGEEVSLRLPGGQAGTVVFEARQDHGGGIHSWVGYFKERGKNNRVILTTGPAGSYGSIDTAEGSFRVVPGADGKDWLVDMGLEQMHVQVNPWVNDVKIPPAEAKAASAERGRPSIVDAAPGVFAIPVPKATPSLMRVDLMFVVTTGLANRLGAGLMTRLYFLITRANTTYADSEVGIILRFVKLSIVNYPDSGDNGDALDEITPAGGGGTGVFANIETERAAAGADLVAFMRDGSSFGGSGVAWLGSTSPNPLFKYSVTTGCVQGCESVFIHEVGHNMGNKHDRHTNAYQNGGTGGGAFAYSFGYAYCQGGTLTCTANIANGTPGTCISSQPECAVASNSNFRDIMAYFQSSTQEVYRFSNPSLTNCATANGDGIQRPCGINSAAADSADAAQSMNNNRANISGIKTQVSADLMPGSLQFTAVTFTGSESGGTVTFTVSRMRDATLVGGGGAVSVQWSLASGTATAGADFTAASGTLNWADGDFANKTFNVTVANDGVSEGTESFTATLSNAAGATGVFLGYPTSASGLILEPWPVGTLAQLPTDPPVGWNSPASPASSVAWSIANDSAPAGDPGARSLKSGAIDFAVRNCNDSSQGAVPCPSAVELARNFSAGTVSFQYRLSAFTFYGVFEFMIDNVVVLSVTGDATNAANGGDTGWRQFSTAVTGGNHTLKWQYRPRLTFACNSGTVGNVAYPGCQDRAWIDQLSLPANAVVANPPRLFNIATRMQVLTGGDVMIGGFVIGGSQPKTVVVRARGPSLTAAGVPGAMANPNLQLFSGPTQIAANDDFGTTPNLALLNASGFAPSNPLESAIYTTLNPGPYTAIVSGVGGTTGVGIVEVFEVDTPTVPLINIATRGRVLGGADVMIGGFIVQGTGPQTVVVRARGPSLAAAGVTGVLANPNLQLFSGSTELAANNDWGSAANATAIQGTGLQPSDALESAIMMTLNPGAYTAIVSGVGGTTGVAIVEVFTVP